MRYLCCIMFALLLVMLFHFVLARYRSRVARTESDEILESAMSYYTHGEPEIDLIPYGVTYDRIERKGY